MNKDTDKLRALVAGLLADANGKPEEMGDLIEGLARCLGLVVAIACRGNAKGIDEMIAGAEAYAHQEAVSKARFAQVMSRFRP